MDFVVAHPDVSADPARVQSLFEAAAAACPAGFDPDSAELMLPRRPARGKCRLCGAPASLTKEHIPPRASGNTATGRAHRFTDWLTSDDRRRLTGGVTEQGGIWGYTLCADCNSATGRLYGTEYQGWAVRAVKIFAGLPPLHELDRNPSPFGAEVQFGGESDGGVAPGAFVRQVLSCMCTLSCAWDLAEQHQAVPRIVLDRATQPLPAGLHLGMALYAGPNSRMSGPQLKIDVESGSWEWVIEMAHPPFAFKMILATNAEEPYIGLDLAPLTLEDPRRRAVFTAELLVGFGWTPYPCDYRSSAALGWGDAGE